jgi:DNA-binding LytR/AlgR family response regulator
MIDCRKMTAIAIDDEPFALEVIKSHASKVPFLELKETFTHAFKAAEYLQNEKIDLLFLDIKMPDITGMEFLKSLPDPPMTIFTTAYPQHAVQGFELNAIDYLLKPFSLSRFLNACNKAQELYLLRNSHDPSFIYIKSGHEQIRVNLPDILYIASAGNYVNFILSESKVLSRLSMQEALAILPEEKFIRIHRSYIIAIHKIEKTDYRHVWINNIPIPVGKSYEGRLQILLNR